MQRRPWQWVCSSGSHLLTAVDGGSVSDSRDATNSKRNAPAVSRRLPPSTAVSKWEPLEQTQNYTKQTCTTFRSGWGLERTDRYVDPKSSWRPSCLRAFSMFLRASRQKTAASADTQIQKRLWKKHYHESPSKHQKLFFSDVFTSTTSEPPRQPAIIPRHSP